MSNILRATKYQLAMFIPQSLSCLLILAINILISITVTNLFPGSGISAGSSDLIVLIWILILGLSFFIPSFKFILSNAVSRKSLFWANILSLAIVSVIWAGVLTIVLSLISKMNIKVIVLYNLFYKDNSTMGTMFWFIGIFFLLATLGWFITMVYYRSSKRMSYAISFSPFILSGLLTIINQSTNGKLIDAFINFFITAMGFSGNIPNPYIGSFSMLLLTVIICSFNYLLIRKAQIKD